MRNLFLVAVFFIITPLTLTVSIFSILSLPQTQMPTVRPASGQRLFASLPANAAAVSEMVVPGDARNEIIRQYLNRYQSPLAPLAEKIVAEADKNGLDFRLTTAIAQQESNLCKNIPAGSYNCWGWGIHKKGTLGFTSFAQGVEVVTRGLANEYLAKGYVSIEEIMHKYTPASNGSWADGVNEFLNEMQ